MFELLDRQAFAKRLRVKRAELQISQKELADQIGIGASNISMYESEQSIPNTQTLYLLSQALDCTPNFLLGFKDEERR